MFDFSSVFLRLQLFFDHFLVVGAIAGAYLMYRWFFSKVTAHRAKSENDKATFTQALKGLCVMAPFLLLRVVYEEFLFRGPLLLFFASLTPEAWTGIIVSSLLFGSIHIRGDYAKSIPRAPWKRTLPDGMELPRKRPTTKREELVLRALRFCVTSLCGALFGYLVIARQTLWYPIAAHVLWNLTLTIGGLAIIMIFGLIVLAVVMMMMVYEMSASRRSIVRMKKMRDRIVN